MKNIVILCLMIFSNIIFSQTKIATTEDGKKVILNQDKTWEYINKSTTTETNCNITENFIEPKSDKGINSWLKKFDATTEDLKKHVAIENDCKVEDITLLNISEQKGNGMYSLCVRGKKMKYKRMGSVFSRANEELFKG